MIAPPDSLWFAVLEPVMKPGIFESDFLLACVSISASLKFLCVLNDRYWSNSTLCEWRISTHSWYSCGLQVGYSLRSGIYLAKGALIVSLRERFLAFAQAAENNKGSDKQISTLDQSLTKFTRSEQRTLFATIAAGISEGPIVSWEGLLDQSDVSYARMNELFRDPNIATYLTMGCNKVMNFNPEILK